jgi:hypothetical protein
VLIDGGSGLNLIFASTLRKMGLDFTDMLVPSKSPFYGIVPSNAVHPLGTVVLPVTFGTRITTAPNSLNSKLLTSNLLIMPYWADRHLPNSWQCRIMFICFSRCQDKVEYSLSKVT